MVVEVSEDELAEFVRLFFRPQVLHAGFELESRHTEVNRTSQIFRRACSGLVGGGAVATEAARSLTPGMAYRWVRWVLTATSLMNSSRAISRLDVPLAARPSAASAPTAPPSPA
jgi:hypothetical protein